MTESWPLARAAAAPDTSRWWLRTLVLGSTPVVVAAITGTMLWLAISLGELPAASIAESLPAWPLTIAAVLGGRLEGEFVNVSSTGVWGVAFALPLFAGLFVGRSLRSGGLRTYGLGVVASGVSHLLVALGLGLGVAFDPTSFGTAAVAWVPVSSFATAGLVWGVAWLAREREAARSAWLVLAASMVLGAGVGVVAAIGEGLSATLLPAAGLVGAMFGPNLAGFAMVWGSGIDAGMLGGARPDVGSFPAFADDVGHSVWIVPLVAFAGTIVAASRTPLIGSLSEFWRRSRDVVIGATLFVALVAALGSPRFRDGPGAAGEHWLGVDGIPGALVTPVLLLVGAVLVPPLAMSVRAGQRWPAEVIGDVGAKIGRVGGGVRGWASAPAGDPRTQVAPHHPAPADSAAPEPTGTPTAGATSVAGMPPGVAAQPAGPTWPVQPTVPAWPGQSAQTPPVTPHQQAAAPANPFEDDTPPPVSSVWTAVAPAADDPGAAPTATAVAPAVAPPTEATPASVPEPSWRHAPPPSFPPSAAPTGPSSTTGPSPFPAAGAS